MDVIIADGRSEVRSALRLLLAEDPRARVIREVRDTSELLAAVREGCPDVVLLDWELPDTRPVRDGDGTGNGRALLPVEISSVCPHARVIVLSGRIEAERPAMAAGADAFVCKCESPERLLGALRAVNGRD
jgi:DNA-binding NarL/FixJ family response regulator